MGNGNQRLWAKAQFQLNKVPSLENQSSFVFSEIVLAKFSIKEGLMSPRHRKNGLRKMQLKTS